MKTGYVAIVGLPNAGKSTLLNSIIGQKVSIVSPKPQTTRNSILGIWTDEDSQIVFVDTPGFLTAKNKLGDYMVNAIDSSVEDVDCILLVIDGHNGISEKELAQIDRYAKKNIPLVVAVTKIDITQPEKLLPQLSKLNIYSCISEIFPISAKRNKNIVQLRDSLKKYLKGDTMLFDADDITNRSTRFMVTEIIREKVLLAIDEEIPHGVAVVLNLFQQDDKTGKYEIDANIVIEKASHKPIILGRNGSMIKSIGILARKSIAKLLGNNVHLTLWVKVIEDWRDNMYQVNQLGYSDMD